MKEKTTPRFMVVYLLLFCSAFAMNALRRPYLNWDMIGYVASAFSYETDDPRELHKDVYERLRLTVPQASYRDLTTGHLREILATDPQSLQQHLPFYQIRVVYVLAIAGMRKLGMNPFVVSYALSTLSATLAIVLLVYMPPGKRHPAYQLLVPAVAVASGFSSLAKYSTPDALAVLSTYFCYFLALRRQKLLLLMLPFSVLVRTDSILLAPLFATYLWQERVFNRRLVAGSALLCLSLYVAVNYCFGNYGWSTVFDYTLSHKSTHPADFPHVVTVASYLAAFKVGVRATVSNSLLLIYVVMTFASTVRLLPRVWRRQITASTSSGVLFVLLSSFVYVVLHFLLFPVDWTRFFAGQYGLALAFAVYLLTETGRSNKADAPDGL